MNDTFDTSSYPDNWNSYVGQEPAKRQLKLAIASAKARRAPLGHVFLSGASGQGKTALATLIAREVTKGRKGAKWKLISPPVSWVQYVILVDDMADGDVVVFDEAHRLVEGGKRQAEWLLHLLENNVLASGRGLVQMPKITIIAATTDPEKLPDTIKGRFPIQPNLEPYSAEEAAKIVQVTAKKILGSCGLAPISPDNARVLASAGNHNPRAIRRLLTTLRDLAITGATEHDGKGYDVGQVLEFTGVTEDGLDRVAREYLRLLVDEFDGKAGARAISGRIGQATEDAERTLLERGLITRTTSGRQVSPAGVTRTLRLKEEEAA